MAPPLAWWRRVPCVTYAECDCYLGGERISVSAAVFPPEGVCENLCGGVFFVVDEWCGGGG